MNRVVFLLISALLFTHNAHAESKYALVIGNGNYESGPLKNPPHDAKLIGETLKNLGFKLIGGEAHINLNREKHARLVIEFGDRLHNSQGIGIFYYAGHGIQVRGKNFLIPVDAKLERSEHLEIYALPMEQILVEMEEAQNKLNLIILDACRNNPFPSNTRSTTRGVKVSTAPSGTLILYSTRPGMLAQDGRDDHSPFTLALSKYMQKAGLMIEDVMRLVIKEVEEKTNYRQTPWLEGFVRERFYFVPPEPSNKNCPSGTHLNGNECVVNTVACPNGSYQNNGQCIAQQTCTDGKVLVQGRGCISSLSMSNNTSPLVQSQNLTQKQKITQKSKQVLQNKTQPSSLLRSIPKWSLITLGLGITAHVLNYLATGKMMKNSTFITVLTAYTATATGIGYGLFTGLNIESDSAQSHLVPIPKETLPRQVFSGINLQISF